ncbi:MAG: hypothetical protein IPI34_05515 [bacterium]|nr:hypothetical protein [bacterium]
MVYAIKQSFDTYVAIDLCGSGYDTRVFVYDYLRNLVACNDDNASANPPCSGLDSRIDVLLLEAGIPYYIIIDGYGGGSGDYAPVGVGHRQPGVDRLRRRPGRG